VITKHAGYPQAANPQSRYPQNPIRPPSSP
jgi:hypothetical protein